MAQAHDQQTAPDQVALASLLAFVSDFLMLVDAAGTIRYANASYTSFLGQEPNVLIGTNLLVTVHEDDQMQVRGALEALAAAPDRERALTIRQRHADTTWRQCQITLHNRLDDPHLAGIVVIARDITAVREAQRPSTAAARLSALQTMTDAALAHLDLNALLRHVLERITAVLHVDNAAVLLVDKKAGDLTVHVARGPEEQVEGQMRIPLGQGLAGQIAATNAPLIVEDLSRVAVVNPVLQKHVRSFMGVPLREGGSVVGVLHVGTSAPFQFSDEDLHWLELVADRVAVAVKHAQIYGTVQQARAEAVTRAGEIDAVVDAVADAVFVYDTDGGIVRSNAAARQLFGFTSDADYPQLPLAERLERTGTSDERGRPLMREQWPQLRVLSGEHLTGSATMDVIIHSLAGRVMRVNVSGAPIRDPRGVITGGVLVLRDVTARAATEDLQRQQSALMALARDAIIVRDPAGAIIEWNAGASALYGWRPADAIGRVTHELLQTRVVGAGVSIRSGPDVDQILVAEGEWEGTQEHTRSDGVKVIVESRQALLRDEDQQPIAILEINRDVTAREAFLAATAHDLKTPLTSIRGQAQLARRRIKHLHLEASAPIEQHLVQIEEGTRRAQRLLDELSDVTRVRAGVSLDLERHAADLVALVRSVVAQQAELTKHRIQLETSHPVLDAVIDGPRIERVVGNLLSNAAKYSPEERSIMVEITRLGDERRPIAVIVIRDQGVGIPARDVPFVFDRFHRGATSVGSMPGTGIGLASARTIVEQHGGTIGVESTEGTGTVVVVRLPLIAP